MKQSPIKRRGRSRFPARRDPDYLEWIRTLRCIACLASRQEQTTRTEATHVRSQGAGGYDRGDTVPLCSGHHVEEHTVGIKTFAARYMLNLEDITKALAERYAA